MLTREDLKRAGYEFRESESNYGKTIVIVNPDGWEFVVPEWQGSEENLPIWERALAAAFLDYQIRDMAQHAGLIEWVKANYDQDLYNALVRQTGNHKMNSAAQNDS